jgi:hypothetical protein
MAETIQDGNASWEGGCDLSRHPALIADNQYRLGCNVMLPKSGGGITSRFGIHHVRIKFDSSCDENLFNTGNFQAEGWFDDGFSDYLCVSISGFIFVLRETFNGLFAAKCINPNDQNNPFKMKGYFTRVPLGVIFNDGESLPYYITADSARRSKPEDQEIGVGTMGIYVQNRFWYVTPDKKEIKYSDFMNPISIAESINANLPSFVPPEDSDQITAIGAQKKMLNYAEGGTLVFSTTSNIYSVDVRGAAESWEEAGTSVGKVQESVRGVSATSPNSFTPFNTNLYFRTREYGVCDLRQSETQFQRSDDFTSQSIEVDKILSEDTTWMLDQCYTRTFYGRVYTTIAPEFNENGRVFWNGLLAYHPNPVYSGQQMASRRFEGIVTGVRPWGITSVSNSRNRDDRFFIWSYDADGQTRLYQMRPDSNVDMNHIGRPVRVRGFVETRGYAHKNIFMKKTPTSRVINLKDIGTNLEISFYSKSESQGKFQLISTNKYLVDTFKQDENNLHPISGQKQQRVWQVLPEEKSEVESGKQSGNRYYFRTDRFEFTGDFTLDSFFRFATLERPDTSVSKSDESPSFEEYIGPRMFTYQICQNDN